MKIRTVVVFGIFDGVHLGHESFFKQAHAHGRVVAIVGRDGQAREHKGKTPGLNERQRVARVAKHPLISHAVLGDKKSGEYKILAKIKPDVICLGYDQKKLGKDLERWMNERESAISVHILKAHKGLVYHTSLLKKS